MTFAPALRQRLQDKPLLSRPERQILGILRSAQTGRRKRRIARMERHARVELGLSENEPVDWSGLSDVDWLKVFKILVSIIGIILMIL